MPAVKSTEHQAELAADVQTEPPTICSAQRKTHDATVQCADFATDALPI
jgi:hypothetical protein